MPTVSVFIGGHDVEIPDSVFFCVGRAIDCFDFIIQILELLDVGFFVAEEVIQEVLIG